MADDEDDVELLHILPSAFRQDLEQLYDNVVSVLPCTSLQEAMLSVDDPTSNGTYYNQIVFSLHGDVDRLKAAWKQMVQRHIIFRTRFWATQDARHPFVQVILRDNLFIWRYASAGDLSPSALANTTRASFFSALNNAEPPYAFTVYRQLHGDDRALVLSIPHAMYDSASLAKLLQEVETVYHGSSLDTPIPFEPFLSHARSSYTVQASEYWASQLRDFEPTAFPDLTGKSTEFRSSLSGHKITDRLLDLPLSQIRAACKEQGISLKEICQAAWARVLSSYSGELDICFGTVVSGRTVDVNGVTQIVAPCFNTIPLRVHMEGGITSHQLMQKLRLNNADSLDYQLSSLRQIQFEHCTSRQPLFDTLVIVQQAIEKLDDRIWTFEADIGLMNFTIVSEFIPNLDEDNLKIRFHSKRAVLLDSDIPCVLDTLTYAFQSSISSPNSMALDFHELCPRALSRCSTDFSSLEVGDCSLLHHGFEQNARERPAAPALDFLQENGQRTIWSYEKLNFEADRIAELLFESDVKAEQAVPIHLSKSPLFYASVLGVLKTGGVFTPFDTQLPADRKAYMLQELGAQLVISDENLDHAWCKARVLNVSENIQTQLRGLSLSLLPSNLAYHIYTSGSTGEPKAVSIEHRNAVQTVAASKSLLRWTDSSRLLNFASTSFDMCYYDCFVAWSYGFCLCAASQTMMFDDLRAVINALSVTILDLTPSVASSLQREEIPSVKLLYCIGEPMRQSIVEEWEGRCMNSYGPSEAAMAVSIIAVGRETKPSVFGKPFSTTSFRVRQNQTNLVVPVLGIGELCLGGSQLARGYLAREELTAKSFFEEDGQRYYRTRDIVRQLGNGTYEFVGRADDQVKIRGLRVELGEIEAVVRKSNDSITGTSVHTMRRSAQAKDQIVVFIASRDTPMIGHGALKETVLRSTAKLLPEYMIPSAICVIESIPLSAAGKVDRRALLRHFQESNEAAEVEPGEADKSEQIIELTAIEKQVQKVLSEISKESASNIHRHTSIYSLGMDSISAIQMTRALLARGLTISASQILQSPTLQGIAGKIVAATELRPPREKHSVDLQAFDRLHRARICAKLGLRSAHIAAIRPCTSLQAGMIAQTLRSAGSSYMYHTTFQLDDDVDLENLSDSWDVALEKYEMLRTGFTSVDDRQHPFAMITYRSRAVTSPVQVSSERDFDFKARRHQVAIDIVSSPHYLPWRVSLRHSGTAKFMDLSIVHSLYDATSLRFILSDVAQACRGDLPLTPSASIDRALARIIEGSLSRDPEIEQRWRSVADKVTVSRFPKLSPSRFSNRKLRTCRASSTKPLSESQERCRMLNTTMQVATQVVWARLLSAYSGESSVTFGTVLSGRAELSTEPFPCVTTVPVSIDTDQSDASLLKSLLQIMTNNQVSQFVPLTEIQRWVGHDRDALFDTLFAYQKQDRPYTQAHQPWYVIDEHVNVDYPVSIEIEPQDDDQLRFCLTFRPDRIPESQAAQMLAQFDQALQTLLNPDNADNRSVTSIDTSIWSITPAKEALLPSGVTLLHEFVEFGAKRHPNRIAFEFFTSLAADGIKKRSWTYDGLNQAGNRVSNLLQQYKVPQGSIVGVCFDKCPEASFTILGILKAGCSFLALDTQAPKARKAFILKDSNASALITTPSLIESFEDEANSPCPLVVINESMINSMPSTQVDLERAIKERDTAFCLYTSGTTGTPKGCILSHLNACQFILAFQRVLRWDGDDCFLQFASFHFDVSVMEQYWSWSVGMRVASASRDLILSDINHALRSMNITHLDLTPSLARLLDPKDLPCLTTASSVFITGGEQLKSEIIDDWGPHGVIHNGYGPTEATIGVTMHPRVPSSGLASNIGRQFDNVGTFVLRPGTAKPVLRGCIGELCVSGPLVAKGYLNRPELTDQCFHHIEINGQIIRVYRTGDLVRILHDGSFSFIGRIDGQIKLRGQRLEVGEINTLMKQSDKSVADVATLVLKRLAQQKDQLVSFVVNESTASSQGPVEVVLGRCNIGMLIEACRTALPGYMVPTHVIPLNALPLTANNKVDVNRLKQLYADLDISVLEKLNCSGVHANDPWSGSERKVAALLAHYTNQPVDNIKRSSSIYELGVDSISVIGFASLLKEHGHHKASLSNVLKNLTVASLAQALKAEEHHESDAEGDLAVQAKQMIAACENRHKAAAAEALFIQQSNIECIAPCTPLQQGMISHSVGSGTPSYFAQFNFEVHKTTDLTRLQQAFRDVVQSAQILRTRFVSTDDGHIQVVVKQTPLVWKEVDTRHKASKLEEVLSDEHHSWWQDNETIIHSPMHIVIVKHTAGCVLALHMFHGIYDGISLPLTIRFILARYNGATKSDFGPPYHSTLPHGPLRGVYKGAEEFWLHHLGQSASVIRSLPRLIPWPSVEDVILTTTSFDVHGLEDCRRGLNATNQALIQACWSTVLHSHFGAPVAQGVVVSGRSIDVENAQTTIGPMFHTIPFTLQLPTAPSWAAAVKSSHDFNAAAIQYHHTPLRDIVKWHKKNSSSVSEPLFETLFVFQKRLPESKYPAIWTEVTSRVQADYPLAFEVEQTSDGSLNLTLVAKADTADIDILRKLEANFKIALTAMVADPAAAISESINIREVPLDAKETSSKLHFSAHANGKAVESVKRDYSSFVWTEASERIRTEIALLSEVESANVEAHRSILELGLDSIDAIKLSSRLTRALGVRLSVSDIMRCLTVARMTEQVNSSQRFSQASQAIEGPTLLRREEEMLTRHLREDEFDLTKVERVIPVTPLQEAMLTQMVVSGYKEYFNHDVFELDADTDIGRLKKAWRRVVDQHPVLRTCFVKIANPSLDASFVQVVHKVSPALPFTDCGPVNQVKAMQERIRKEFDTCASPRPPLRLTWLEDPQSGACTQYMLSLSHAIYDGFSISLLHEDVRKAYRGLSIERPSYDSALNSILECGTSDQAKEHWQSALKAYRSALLTRKRVPKSTSTLYRKERISVITSARAKDFCKGEGVTMSALGQTAWALVLASHVQSLEVAFGVVLSCRDDEDANRVMFPTMNTVVVRADIHGSRSEMLKSTQESMTAMAPFKHYPLRKVQALARTPSGLFDALFVYQKRPEISSEGNHASQLYHSIGGASDVEYPICVEVEVTGDQLVWRNACKGEYLDDNGAELLLRKLDHVLQEIIYDAKGPVVTTVQGGVSICGLPSFEESQVSNSIKHITRQHANGQAKRPTVPSKDNSQDHVKAIRSVLAKVAKLSAKDVTSTSTIFNLGLDSISAIKVSNLLHKQGITLRYSDMVKAGSVADMAAVASKIHYHDASQTARATTANGIGNGEDIIRSALSSSDVSALLSKAKVHETQVDAILPATAGQAYMLSMFRSHGLFHATFRYRTSGRLSFGDLRKAWSALVECDANLRTSFVATKLEDIPFVRIVRAHSAPEPTVNGIDRKVPQPGSHLVGSPTPFLALYAEYQADGWQLLLLIQHALYDRVSLSLLLSKLEHFCNEPSSHPCVLGTSAPLHHSNVTREVAESLSSAAISDCKSFWCDYFSNIETMPLLQPRPQQTRPRGRVEFYDPSLLTSFRTTSLLQTARDANVSIQALFLAAYATVYARLLVRTGNSGPVQDIIIGIYLANRTSFTLESTQPTLNLVPLRIGEVTARSIPIIAQDVQNDLTQIAEGSRNAVALWEIERWVGKDARCGTWVNFLGVSNETAAGKMAEVNKKLKTQANGHGIKNARVMMEETHESRSRGSKGYERIVPQPNINTPAITDSKDGNVTAHDANDRVLHEEDQASLASRAIEMNRLLSDSTVGDCYISAIDIEAAVRDGILAVGLFCDESLLDLDGAKGVIAELKGELEGLLLN